VVKAIRSGLGRDLAATCLAISLVTSPRGVSGSDELGREKTDYLGGRFGHGFLEDGTRGQHYVPQRYLRGFETPAKPSWVWMYDKIDETHKFLPIKHIAQAAEFYADDVEKSLNVDVEMPGNDVIDKLRRGQPIDETDRLYVTYYVAAMIRRVPHARGKGYAMVPKVLAETAARVRDYFQREHREGRIDSERLADRLAEADATESKFRNQPPSEVMEVIETPWPFASMLFAIDGM
jgi:hypothetical protein